MWLGVVLSRLVWLVIAEMECLRIAVVAFCLVQCTSFGTSPMKDELRLDGDDFMSFNLREKPSIFGFTEHTLRFAFKTTTQNGMLVYIGSRRTRQDFLMVDLVRGKLRVTGNLGGSIPTRNGHLVLDEQLADNHWQSIALDLVGNEMNVTHAQQTRHVVLQSKDGRLDVTGFVFVGGLPKRIRKVLRRYKPSPNWRGCLRNVSLDGWQVLLSARSRHYKVYGSPEQKCPHREFETLSFQYPGSYLSMPSTGKDLFNVQMQFRTYIASGVLARKFGSAGRVIVSLLDGKVVLDVSVVGVSQVPPLIQGESLNDGEWHRLSVVITGTEIKLKVDSRTDTWLTPVLNGSAFSNDSILFIGHFEGCMSNVRLDGRAVKLGQLPHHVIHNVDKRCNMSSRCFPNPCRHGGKCSDLTNGSFSCDCQTTFYRGPLCEQPLYLRTCQDYKNLGLVDDAYCKVDPDAEGPSDPVEVVCNMTDRDRAVTVVHHNHVGPQPVSSCLRVYGKYFFYLWYDRAVADIKALITESQSCRQLVGFQCFGSKLLQSPAGPAEVNWVGGDYDIVSDYWPGAPAHSMNCACGVNATCADPRLGCNCDIGDKTWREDKGYLTDKNKLPMLALQFTASAAPSYFTVGPLECWGTALNRSSELPRHAKGNASRFLDFSCRLVNPTVPASRPSSPTPSYTERETEPTTWKVQKETTLPPGPSSPAHVESPAPSPPSQDTEPTTGQTPTPGPSSPGHATRPAPTPCVCDDPYFIAKIVVVTGLCTLSFLMVVFLIALAVVACKNRCSN